MIVLFRPSQQAPQVLQEGEQLPHVSHRWGAGIDVVQRLLRATVESGSERQRHYRGEEAEEEEESLGGGDAEVGRADQW